MGSRERRVEGGRGRGIGALYFGSQGCARGLTSIGLSAHRIQGVAIGWEIKPFQGASYGSEKLEREVAGQHHRSIVAGARGGTRTHTPLRTTDFKSVASANSATRATSIPGSDFQHTGFHSHRLSLRGGKSVASDHSASRSSDVRHYEKEAMTASG